MKAENKRIQDIAKFQNKHDRLGKSKYFTKHVIKGTLVIFVGIDLKILLN